MGKILSKYRLHYTVENTEVPPRPLSDLISVPEFTCYVEVWEDYFDKSETYFFPRIYTLSHSGSCIHFKAAERPEFGKVEAFFNSGVNYALLLNE